MIKNINLYIYLQFFGFFVLHPIMPTFSSQQPPTSIDRTHTRSGILCNPFCGLCLSCCILPCCSLSCCILPCCSLSCCSLPCCSLPCCSLPCCSLSCCSLPCCSLSCCSLSCFSLPCCSLFRSSHCCEY